MRLLFLVVALSLVHSSPVPAIQASPHIIHDKQPDGSVIALRLRGDEYFHWHEDRAGYTVVRDKGRYVYARLDKNSQWLKPTHWEVGKVDPAAQGLQPRTLPPPAVIRQRHSGRFSVPAGNSAPAGSGAAVASAAAASGTVRNLVIMIRFSNHTGRTLPGNADIDVLFNAPGGDVILAPTGSVRDVYIENSYGQLVLDSTVVGWVDVSHTEQYYANGQSGDSTLWQALREALDEVDTLVDFNDFDADNDGRIDSIAFIHSGYGAEWGGTDADGTYYDDRIWSHRWTIQPAWTSAEGVTVSDYHISPGLWGTSGAEIGRIGVIAHETGHFLGLPDLYDTDPTPGEGIGSWGLMANSWGFDNSQYYPPHFSAWSKIGLGWVTPTLLSTPGTYSVPQVESAPVIYRIDANYPTDEYLLIENRQPTGFDGAIPQGGLAIWHIDDQAGYNTEGYPGQGGWPFNGNHYRVALLQADGNYDLEKGNNRGDSGDAYHGNGVSVIAPYTVPDTDAYQQGSVGATGNILSGISVSGATMSFDYGPPPPEPTYTVRSERHEADWIDATAGIRYSLTNDGSVPLPIGFALDFYGTPRTSVTVSANGYLTFGPDAAVGQNTSLPDPSAPNGIIAPFWDDLNPGLGGAVYVLMEGTAPYRRTTIAWVDIPHATATGTATFETTLYEANSDIVFRYQDVDFGAAGYDRGASATIGVEDETGTDATLYTYNYALIDANDALRFSTRKDVLLVDDDDNDPNVRSFYTTPLGQLGATWDVWDSSAGDPDSATLSGYKGVIWFSGDRFGNLSGPAGPGPAGETALGNYLDAGACLFISSQDYYFDQGLTAFMSNYLGAASATSDVFQTSVAGSGTGFAALGPYTLSLLFDNWSDIVNPDATAYVAFSGDKGNAAIARVTPTYSTSFWGFPFELINDAGDRQDALEAVLRFCANVEIDTDADSSANSHDTDDDNDGLSDLNEVTLIGTDPYRADSDGDGLSDFDEVNRDGNPDDYNPAVDTNPLATDTDGDTYSDAAEVAAGSDPLDPGSIPVNNGDINGDGQVNVVDVLLGLRALFGQITLTPDQLLRADVAPVVGGFSTPDGLFTPGDLVVIERKALGLMTF